MKAKIISTWAKGDQICAAVVVPEKDGDTEYHCRVPAAKEDGTEKTADELQADLLDDLKQQRKVQGKEEKKQPDAAKALHGKQLEL